jgi:hypothetical protein
MDFMGGHLLHDQATRQLFAGPYTDDTDVKTPSKQHRCRRPTIHPSSRSRARRLFATKPEPSLATPSVKTRWNPQNGEHTFTRDARFLAAGNCAEQLAFPGIAPLNNGTDRALSRIYAESICALVAVPAFLEYVRQEATALLVSQRHVLEALADALEARRTLDTMAQAMDRKFAKGRFCRRCSGQR